MAAAKDSIDTKKVIDTLNAILEIELAGVVRYMHYSLMIFGHSRIPIVQWMRDQATEGMAHATQAGELITSLGGHPSLKIGRLLETHKHDIDQILREAFEHEKEGITQYRNLLGLVAERNVRIEEYARGMIADEESHLSEIEKMLRPPGKLRPAG